MNLSNLRINFTSLSREYTESRSSALSILSSDALQVSANTLALAHLLCPLA